MEQIIKVESTHVDLTAKERNLLSNVLKREILSKRTFLKNNGSNEHKGKMNLKNICHSTLDILDRKLIPYAESEKSKVFYYKMKGEYYQYLADYYQYLNKAVTGNAKNEATEKSLAAYNIASDTASTGLPPTHPVHLDLALSLSAFYHDVLNSPDKACSIAKTAFDQAISELDCLSEESYKDSTLKMQLLRDNLTLWSAEGEGQLNGNH
ncbi:14-3-3 protein epsilon-like [Mytilus trossulus]|uniref:14-3-3 protein epsilon-like n=1 Tax=Mytilus trossulus TaxID=6551 RepID=UPI003004E40F